MINARETDPAWLPTHVKKLMRKRKGYKSYNIHHFETYKQFKKLAAREIRKSKKIYLLKLASPNTKQNNWWKTINHFIKPDQADVIPPLNKNRKSTLRKRSRQTS